MKQEPISAHDRAMIIQRLASRDREWQGIRMGCRIRLVRFRTPQGERIEYAVQIKISIWVNGNADTVHGALDECSDAIRKARFTRPEVMTPDPLTDPRGDLPQAVPDILAASCIVAQILRRQRLRCEDRGLSLTMPASERRALYLLRAGRLEEYEREFPQFAARRPRKL